MVGDSQEVKEDWHMVLPREEDYIGRNKAYRGSSDFFWRLLEFLFYICLCKVEKPTSLWQQAVGGIELRFFAEPKRTFKKADMVLYYLIIYNNWRD